MVEGRAKVDGEERERKGEREEEVREDNIARESHRRKPLTARTSAWRSVSADLSSSPQERRNFVPAPSDRTVQALEREE